MHFFFVQYFQIVFPKSWLKPIYHIMYSTDQPNHNHNHNHVTLRHITAYHHTTTTATTLYVTVTVSALNSVGRPFFYRIQASHACCPPSRREGACEETGWACPPLPVLGEYLCSVTLVPGTPERLGTGRSHGCHHPDKSGWETDDLMEERLSFMLSPGLLIGLVLSKVPWETRVMFYWWHVGLTLLNRITYWVLPAAFLWG